MHFSVPEGVTAPADAAGYTGDTFTFPQPSGTPSDTAHDYTFLGWAAAPQTDTDSRLDFSAAGAEQMFTQAEQTYYALYYYKVDDPDAVGDEYRRVMVAPDDWTGSYCIVSSDKGKIMTNTPGSKPTYLEAADIEIDTGASATRSGSTRSRPPETGRTMCATRQASTSAAPARRTSL